MSQRLSIESYKRKLCAYYQKLVLNIWEILRSNLGLYMWDSDLIDMHLIVHMDHFQIIVMYKQIHSNMCLVDIDMNLCL